MARQAAGPSQYLGPTKPYNFAEFGDIRRLKAYEFIWFLGMHSAELSRSLKVWDSGRNTSEAGPKAIGIGSCRSAGTAPGILGLASSGLGAGWGPTSTIFGRILNGFPVPFCSAEQEHG